MLLVTFYWRRMLLLVDGRFIITTLLSARGLGARSFVVRGDLLLSPQFARVLHVRLAELEEALWNLVHHYRALCYR